jgi:hypothetical protein
VDLPGVIIISLITLSLDCLIAKLVKIMFTQSTHHPVRFGLSKIGLISFSMFFSLFSLSSSAFAADEPPKPPQAPQQAPQQLKVLEEGPEIKPDKTLPEIENTNPNGTKITETRKQGKVTEVEVKTQGSTYYLKPNDLPGSVRGDTHSRQVRPAQFKIFEFNTFGKKSEKDKPRAAKPDTQAAPDLLTPPPPPTPLPAQ